jgi:DegV family protein with EDD domain
VSIRIVTDSACDLPQSIADSHGIGIVPLTIRFGETEYVDRRDLTPKEFWAKSASSATLPETAAPAPGQFAAMYQQMLADGASGIVVVALSSALSATMQSAQLAAADFNPAIIRVVDSQSVTLGQGMVALSAAAAGVAGAGIDEVEALANDLAGRTKIWGALDTLDNLKKGGRIGNARALLASVLSIKPIIEVRGGKVEEGGKQRTRSKALSFVIEKMVAAGPIEAAAVLHADCADVEPFVAQVRAACGVDPLVGDLGAVVGSHAGVGTMGIAFQVRK